MGSNAKLQKTMYKQEEKVVEYRNEHMRKLNLSRREKRKNQCETVTERRFEFEQLETPSEMTPLRRRIKFVSPKVVVVKINAKHSAGSSIWRIHIHLKFVQCQRQFGNNHRIDFENK